MFKVITMEADKNKTHQRHYEKSILIPRGAEEVFAFVDNHKNLSSHMGESSWMMAGSRMETSIGAGHGQEIGSHIKMSGKIFGINLFLDEVITRREPPRVKIWETVGDIKLLVIGHYRMGVEVKPQDNNSLFRVFIDYDLPTTNAWIGKLFGGMYAKWCVRQMIKGARDRFAK